MLSTQDIFTLKAEQSRSKKGINILTGRRFGRLLVLGLNGRQNRQLMWDCLCRCGTHKIVRSSHLTAGLIQSCGCRRLESNQTFKPTHGLSKTSEYRIYKGAKGRCTNPSRPCFDQYGGRGIEFRFTSFEEFLECVGNRPSPKHSLDRIDVNGHYESGNVRWATQTEQANNTRNNVTLTMDGWTMTASEWGRELGINVLTILWRKHHGWSDAEALTRPVSASRSPRQILRNSHPRIWRRATLEQRKQIVERYEQTGSVKEAFKNIRFNRVELSDLTFDTVGGMHVGGSR